MTRWRKNSCLATARRSRNEFYFVVRRESVVSAKRKPELFLLNESYRLIQFIAVLHKISYNAQKFSWKTFWRKRWKVNKKIDKNVGKGTQETVACHIQWHAKENAGSNLAQDAHFEYAFFCHFLTKTTKKFMQSGYDFLLCHKYSIFV